MSHDTSTATRTVGEPDRSGRAGFVIGRDMGPAARLFRLVFGVIAVASLGYRMEKQLDGVDYLAWILYLGLIAAFYVVLFWLFNKSLFQRTSPWVGAALMEIPVLTYPLNVGPAPFHNALAAYSILGTLLCGLMGYGALEVAALPALVLRQRPTLYSPFNTADMVERAFVARQGGRGVLWTVSMVVAAFCFVEYWIVPLLLSVPPAEDWPGEVIRIPGGFAALMLIPAAFLAYRARRPLATTDGPVEPVRRLGLAALFLVVLIPMEAANTVPDQLFGVIILFGLVIGVAALFRRLFRRPANSPA